MEDVAVEYVLLMEASRNAEEAVAVVLSREMAVRVDGFLQIAHHKGRNLMRMGSDWPQRCPLLIEVAHRQLPIKIIILNEADPPHH